MSNATTLESILDLLCSDLHEVISDNFEAASKLLEELNAFKEIRSLFQYGIDGDAHRCKLIVSAAAMSDVFTVLRSSLFADGEYAADELNEAATLLADSMHRYCWLDRQYEPFKLLTRGSDVIELIGLWQDDDSSLGGQFEEGAIRWPFNKFVKLGCVLQGNKSLFQQYMKSLLIAAKLILDVNGISKSEQSHYNDLKANLMDDMTELQSLLVSEKSRKEEFATGAIEDPDDNAREDSPDEILEEGLKELESLIGIFSVKAEVSRLTNFLKVRQHRIDHGMPVPSQSLHFVFTGNPGTGKTTVARIIAKILFGFRILKSSRFVEADRASMVAGYVGQTAIKTTDVISDATNGVLFIDEAYTLSKGGDEDYGQEAIDILLKKMEDLRDRLVVIVAGYPKEMSAFINSNPGLESRFTRFIHFDDYHVSELCQIFERMCIANTYHLTQAARANLAIMFNRVFLNREPSFGNARFVRNAYEKTLGNHSDRLCASGKQMTREDLSTIEAEDLPYDLANGVAGPFDVSNSLWRVACPKCSKTSNVKIAFIGQNVTCKCGAQFRCPWWNLEPTTVPGLVGFEKYEEPSDLIGYDVKRS